LPPTGATGVVLTDTLGANWKYISATTGQGTFTRSGSVVTFSLGSLASGQTATATLTVQSVEDGRLTNTASVTGSVSDADLSNNSLVATTTVTEAPIYVSGNIPVSGKKVTNQVVATFTHANGVEPASAFIAYIGRDLSDILCLQEDRIVGRDNCVSYRRLSLQIPPDRHRHHYVKANQCHADHLPGRRSGRGSATEPPTALGAGLSEALYGRDDIALLPSASSRANWQ
jgi:hypothetical protein